MKRGFIKESCIRAGDSYTNNFGDEFIVIEYLSSSVKTGGVRILFKGTGSTRLCSGGDLLKGEVKDLMKPTVCGVGYIGQGQYSASENGLKPCYYLHWHNMLKRCYEKKGGHNTSYAECSVSPEWLNLQEFSTWCTSQPLYNKTVLGRRTALDKDLLIPNNKVYSKEACLIIPEEINKALVGKRKTGKDRGLPCGIFKHGKKFITYRDSDKRFDSFSTLEDAARDYQQKKEGRIKGLLLKYGEYLDSVTIHALQEFTIKSRSIYN